MKRVVQGSDYEVEVDDIEEAEEISSKSSSDDIEDNILKSVAQQDEKTKLKDDFITRILKGLVEKGKIDDAVDIIHEQGLIGDLKKIL